MYTRVRFGAKTPTPSAPRPIPHRLGFIRRHRSSIAILMLAIATLLAACGGGDGASPAQPPERGTLVQATPKAQLEAPEIDTALAGSGSDSSTLAGAALAGAAVCRVEVHGITYNTLDPLGNPAASTAGLMLPSGKDARCAGPRPVLLYAHGTSSLKSYDMADPRHNPEALLVMAFYAAHGYIVVAPNYLGYDTSSLSWHPYLNAEAQAVDMVDGLRAGLKQVAALGGTPSSGKLVIAGYSQGGFVAMATHEVIERDHASEFTVAAAVPMSGPYNLVKFGDTVTSPTGQVNIGGTLFMPFMLTNYQKSYGGIYDTPSDAYQAPFDKTAEGLFPTDTPIATLMANGELPNDPTFRLLFGPGGLLTDSFRAAYPQSNFRKALQTNTLLGWTPKAPVALCGGAQDPTVFFFNATDMQADFASRGVTVPLWNLEDRASLPAGTSYDEVYDGFRLAKAAAGSTAQTASSSRHSVMRSPAGSSHRHSAIETSRQ